MDWSENVRCDGCRMRREVASRSGMCVCTTSVQAGSKIGQFIALLCFLIVARRRIKCRKHCIDGRHARSRDSPKMY